MDSNIKEQFEEFKDEIKGYIVNILKSRKI